MSAGQSSEYGAIYEASKFASCDQLWAAASYVAKNYGDYGYRLGIAADTGAIAIFEVRCSDGSTFNVAVDRWGNAQGIPEGSNGQDILVAMHKNAVAA